MSTIPQVSSNANALFSALADNLVLDLVVPVVAIDLDIPLPSESGAAYADVLSVTLPDLTTKTIDGEGVFDALMGTMNLHLAEQFSKSRITGKEFAEVYLGGMQAVLQQSVNFLVMKDKTHWESMLVREQVQLAQIQRVTAMVTLQLAKLQVAEQKLTVAKVEIEAHTARAAYAAGKMSLATGFAGIQQSENQTKLVLEQVDTARANTKETLTDGSAIAGLASVEKVLKLAAVDLSNEQIDTARAATKDTLLSGGPVLGIAAQDKLVKIAQVKLVGEQYESQRGQTRPTLSTGEVILGTTGAQTKLYLQQIESFKHDSASKAVKIMFDTWTARKALDDGVLPVSQIEDDALNASMSAYRTLVGVN